MAEPVPPVPPPPFDELEPRMPNTKNAQALAKYEKTIQEFYERKTEHQRKQSIYNELNAVYLEQELDYNGRMAAKSLQESHDYDDENMHTIINKTDGAWTTVAPYFISKVPVQSYASSFNIELRTWPAVLHTLKLREGHYPNAGSLLTELIRISEPVKDEVKWEYLTSKNRFQVDLRNYAIRFQRSVAEVLGFQKILLNAGLVYEAPYRLDLLRGTYHMYVYTDLCENTQVGNVQVPLLRTVPMQDVSYGQVKSYTFTKPIYIPLAKRQFDTIEVQLRNDSGDLLPLDDGKTVLVLHIRPRQV
jgi:hypothetical protein